MNCLQELSFLKDEELTFPQQGISGNKNKITGYTPQEIEVMFKYLDKNKTYIPNENIVLHSTLFIRDSSQNLSK